MTIRKPKPAPAEAGQPGTAFHVESGSMVDVIWEVGTWLTSSGVEVKGVLVGVDPVTRAPLALHESAAPEVRKAINRAVAAKYGG